jgi:hypothetical protein
LKPLKFRGEFFEVVELVDEEVLGGKEFGGSEGGAAGEMFGRILLEGGRGSWGGCFFLKLV